VTASLADIEARLRAGDAAGACAAADAFLAASDLPASARSAALMLRSRAHEALRNLRAAIVDLEGAAALAPQDARVCNELGILYADAGHTARAVGCFRRAVALDAGYARAWNNLGNAERAAANLVAAEAAFERASVADPRYALALANLGAVRRECGDDAGAETALLRALTVDPQQRVALLALAGLRRQQGAIDEAVALYTQAVQRDPRDANAFLQLAGTLAERDEIAPARQAYDAALARDPGLLRAVLGRHLTLPMVAASADAVAQSREAYAAGLDAVARDLPSRAAALTSERVVDELRWTNFLLAYQGGNDCALQSRYGDAVSRVIAERVPQYAQPLRARAAQPRLRVGFVSAFFRDGTAGRYFERWITDLPRDRFDVRVYHLASSSDALTARLAARADAFETCLRWRPSQLAARLRADALDVLVYPELGMDATTFAVAALRLAPVQCAGWGHPVTTGLATIDTYFSVRSMEPGDAQAHYRERLTLLPGLGTRYAMPQAPADGTREAYGLPEDAPLLLWPQSLFKIHPDNDALVARVLAAAPRAQLVLFEGRHHTLTAAYLARLDRALAAEGLARAGRVHVMPQRAHEDYLRINTLCDAMLDTLHWSGGNTSLDAIACGLPIVTLPGAHMRGRQSAGMLQLIGVTDTLAADVADYARIAVRLSRERAWRDELAERIRHQRSVLFDDPEPVEAFASALERLARAV
jgi:CRISPR-associated protein Csy1